MFFNDKSKCEGQFIVRKFWYQKRILKILGWPWRNSGGGEVFVLFLPWTRLMFFTTPPGIFKPLLRETARFFRSLYLAILYWNEARSGTWSAPWLDYCFPWYCYSGICVKQSHCIINFYNGISVFMYWNVLSLLDCWFEENHMRANPVKFQCIVHTKHPTLISVFDWGKQISHFRHSQPLRYDHRW